MKVLITGGTGVVGSATVTELLRRGHSVRLLSRNAEEDVNAWEGPVEARACDIADATGIQGAADGCDVVIHVAGIVDESGPDITFERINIGGTRNIVAEAMRAGARRFVFVSSLGTDRGKSDYHRSKLAGEEIVHGASIEWVVVRTGAVVGPGDTTVSTLLRMMRTLPAIPLIEDGSQPFQPVWHEDVATALAECIERSDVAGQTLNIAGPETLTVSELLDTLSGLTDRTPLRVPVPAFVAEFGSSVASALGVETPASAATVTMLLEGNYLRDTEANDLTTRFGVDPVPIRKRLAQLVDALPEQTPADGTGRLQRRRFEVDITGTSHDAAGVMRVLRERFADIMHVDAAAEPGSAETVHDGATLTLELPGRGHAQVRVEAVDERSFTLATLEGHPLAGIVKFHAEDRDGSVHFAIDIAERPASRIDRIAMALVGAALQKRTWRRTAENLVAATGGTAPAGVQDQSWTLSDGDAEAIESWIQALIHDRQRRTDHRP